MKILALALLLSTYAQLTIGLQKTLLRSNDDIRHPLSAYGNTLTSVFDAAGQDALVQGDILGVIPNAYGPQVSHGHPVSSVYAPVNQIPSVKSSQVLPPYITQSVINQAVLPQFGLVGGYNYGTRPQAVQIDPVQVQEMLTPKLGYLGGYTYPNPTTYSPQPIIPQQYAFVGGPTYPRLSQYVPLQSIKAPPPTVKDSPYKIRQILNPIGYRFF